MTIAGTAKRQLNKLLEPINVKIDSLTAFRNEQGRLAELQRRGHFTKAIFPPFDNVDQSSVAEIVKRVQASADTFKSFYIAADNAVGYSFSNNYFSSPDTEVLYTVIQAYRPARIVEVGSGNSTRIARQAILNAKLSTELISIDPFPRCEVTEWANRVINENVETISDRTLFNSLATNDILFIDSSHEVRCGNDVVFLLLNVVPSLPPGVIIHLHDIFLPFEYPEAWIVDRRWNWNEQYLVQALVGVGNAFDVLWAGHYFQRCNPSFKDWFVHWRGNDAQSLWLRKR